MDLSSHDSNNKDVCIMELVNRSGDSMALKPSTVAEGSHDMQVGYLKESPQTTYVYKYEYVYIYIYTYT